MYLFNYQVYICIVMVNINLPLKCHLLLCIFPSQSVKRHCSVCLGCIIVYIDPTGDLSVQNQGTLTILISRAYCIFVVDDYSCTIRYLC